MNGDKHRFLRCVESVATFASSQRLLPETKRKISRKDRNEKTLLMQREGHVDDFVLG
jgi:hypothetical protein